ncbi:MAG: sigma-70 family RNA polymerase sigma factor, partial [Verrucomicrobiales bacterium]|nr:sigma-70 family RNA polymerase sigma factor [Verrucomicrobiales bacterium]
DETAFGELVRKHLPFVFACARRQVGPDAAYDLSQSVFLILARKANSFGPDVILSSWLFRTTGFAVAQWRRHEARRTRRETAALPMITPALHASRDPDEAWREPLETHLDDALSALSESDRNYVLTRFFERRRFSEVAERFGVSEDAAKKRVARALERMRAHLVARGVAIPATVLGGLLLQPRAEALPEHLAAAVLRTIRDTAISTASQGPVADLAQATLRQATVNSFGRMAIRLLTGLAGAALVWTGVSAARSALRTPPTESSSRAEPAPALASEVLASRAPASTDTQGASLALTLLDATTDRPIADAAIEASQIVATTDDTVDRSEFRTLSTVTDDAGRAVFRLGDRSFARVVVAVSLSRYVVTHLEWRGYEFASGSIDHVCRLLPGVRLTGEVKDPENRPVAEARVILTGETGYEDGARESGTQELALVTDAEGRFESDRVAPRRETFRTRNAGRRLAIRVVHPDFAIGWGELPFDTDPTNHVVLRLHRGSTLAGRILDPSGAPIIGAVVRESAFSGPDREAVSGPTGEFELTRLGSIPLIEGPKADTPVRFGFEVRAAGYRRLEADVAPMTASEAYVHRRSARPGQENSSESVPIVAHPRHPGEVGPAGFRVVLDLVLDPGETLDDDTVTAVPSFPRPPGPIQLRGTVLDDVSGAPVPRFRIATKYRGNEFRTLIGEGRDGAFEWLLPDTSPLALQPPTEIFEQNGFSWPPPETMTFKLVLEANADGYMPAEIETFVENGAMRPVEFRLSGGDEVSGW